MTDFATAANALGVPEGILRRSVEARATASGVSVEDVLAAWTGGGAMPASAPSTPAPSPVSDAPADAPASPQQTAEPAPAAARPDAPPVPAARPAGPVAPPVLVGVNQGSTGVLFGSAAILFLSILLAFVVPSLPQPPNGVRSSNHPFSSGALEGRDLYRNQGCGSCHTQLIRAVVADAKLGPVTLSDSNQVLGYRRIGPDLSAIGRRTEDSVALAALLRGEGAHPTATGLSEEDLGKLFAYLREST